jgi:hypothetical protein
VSYSPKKSAAKINAARAKKQCNKLQSNPAAQITTHLPMVEAPPPKVIVAAPRVAKDPKAEYHIVQIVAFPPVSWPVEQTPVTHSQSWSSHVDAQSSVARPNYILQDEEDNKPPTPATYHQVSCTK